MTTEYKPEMLKCPDCKSEIPKIHAHYDADTGLEYCLKCWLGRKRLSNED